MNSPYCPVECSIYEHLPIHRVQTDLFFLGILASYNCVGSFEVEGQILHCGFCVHCV